MFRALPACADMKKNRKTGSILHVGETGDSPDRLIFYFQPNKVISSQPGQKNCCHFRHGGLYWVMKV